MATREVTQQKYQSFKDLLQKQVQVFSQSLPEKTVGRFIATVSTTMMANPSLLDCDMRSVLEVCRRAAQDGLMLDGREAAIVPFKDKERGLVAQYLPMVAGIRMKVLRTGLIDAWDVTAVQEGDEFSITLGTNKSIYHKPALTGGRKRRLIGVYSEAYYKGSDRPTIVFMNRDEIEDVRTKSKAKFGPWNDEIFYVEMAKKTCAKNHAKSLPQTSDITGMLDRMDDDEGPETPPEPHELLPESIPSRGQRSVASTLEEFGAGGTPQIESTASAPGASPPADTDVQTERGGEGAGTAVHTAAVGPDVSQRRADADGSTDRMKEGGDEEIIQLAYNKGDAARKSGQRKIAMPPEYTRTDRQREAIAWTCGYEAKPLPSNF